MSEIRGISTSDDLKPGLISRDTRSWRQKMRGFGSSTGAGFAVTGIGVSISALPIFLGVTMFADPLLLIGVLIWLYTRNKNISLQFRTPSEIQSDKNITGDGIMYIGSDLNNGAEMWFSNDDLRTHMLVFGSTGSGKTRFLLGLLYQALLVGSGSLYTDGKGDNTVWWLVFSFCRRLGRVDDLLVINYLTGGKTVKEDDNSLSRKSNTNNPFAFGDPEQLRSLIVGLMRDSGGDDMWKGMASAMMGGLLKALVNMRDTGELNLDVSVIRDYLPLDQIVKLSLRPDLKESSLAPIKKYLGELPGYVEDEAILGRIQPKVYEQHGYRIMQFSEVLSDLEDTYGHIFSAPLGECDFKDIVFNRRILFVMLPALEKDPDSLAGLGKLVVAGVRAALGPALGDTVEGQKKEVVDQKPTNSKVPFLMILDEYGYYSVKGFAVVAAQARSLGVSVVFAGQDYPSFKKGSEEEAQATIANTNIKIGMKIEEQETADIIINRAGDGNVTVSEGSEIKTGGLDSYKDSDRVKIENRKRINGRDLTAQKPGQAHVIFADELCRCQLFYAEPEEVTEAYLNKFVMVSEPSKAKIKSINGMFDKINKLFKEKEKEKESNPENEESKSKSLDMGLKILISDFNHAKERNEDASSAAIIALGLVEWRAMHKDTKILEAAEKITGKVSDNQKPKLESKESYSDISPSIKENEVTKTAKESVIDSDRENITFNALDEIDNIKDEDEDEILETIEQKKAPLESSSVKNDADDFRNKFEISLNKSLVMSNPDTILTMNDKINGKPRNALKEIEALKSDTIEEAEREADRGIEILSQIGLYPNNPKPKKLTKEEIKKSLDGFLDGVTKNLEKSKAE